jgi:hypothetical protein
MEREKRKPRVLPFAPEVDRKGKSQDPRFDALERGGEPIPLS